MKKIILLLFVFNITATAQQVEEWIWRGDRAFVQFGGRGEFGLYRSGGDFLFYKPYEDGEFSTYSVPKTKFSQLILAMLVQVGFQFVAGLKNLADFTCTRMILG